MNKVSFPNTNGLNITMSGLINFPENFDSTKTYPAIVVSHPGGGVLAGRINMPGRRALAGVAKVARSGQEGATYRSGRPEVQPNHLVTDGSVGRHRLGEPVVDGISP